MCGIAGYVGRRRLEPALLRAALSTLRHRGPDAEGVYEHHGAERHVYLLHTRLRILDLESRADQPMRRDDQVLCFNGELFNYLELRATLERDGVTFETRSDTEVLLEQLRTHGAAGLDACEGMWAFAFLDRRDGGLLLCRDRFGEKPLYVLEANDGVYFGSEIKALRALSGRPLAVNDRHLCRYLVNGYKSLYKTADEFFDDVRAVAPATVMRIDAVGRVAESRYWVPRAEPDETMSRADAVDTTRAALRRAVDLRLRADVPLAFMLSGGVDSNAIVSIARRSLGRDVHAFTLCSGDERYDEAAQAAAAARELGIRHTMVEPRRDRFLEDLPALVRQHDAPVSTISYYVQWLLLQRIAEAGYRVSVSGTAADELFSGYYDHHLAYMASLNGYRDLRRDALNAWHRHVRPLVRNPFLQNPDLYTSDPAFREHIFFDRLDFAEFMCEPWDEPFHEKSYTPDLLRNRMLNELFHEAVPVILHEDDLNAMAWSVENRSPFLDRQLFEHAYRIPTRHLIHDGYAKSILRDAMRGIAPSCVLDQRRKTGFNASIEELLDLRDPAVRAWILAESPIYAHVRREKIAELLEGHGLPNSRSKFLFSFVNAKVFLEECAA